ncbi:hypothetical protein [Bacillus toyonensis]|uniref:hypothetical protein n=1 Tax=Bacillus toyonensis TaxID=155322 RepID=UPI000BF1C1A0|nr:hypothetical protein [Bacillus toyonensis]PEL24345.1 hypothetical protein CN624_18335 [Bacillus toyonensis]
MKVTVDKKKKKDFKLGDVFQGVSGTLYQIIQDDDSNYRALDLRSCTLRMDKKETPNGLVASFLHEDVHYLRDDIEMIIK